LKRSFVILTRDSWDDPPRARHQVAEAIAKRYPVYFVSSNRVGIPRLQKNCVQTNIHVLTPYYPIDCRVRYRVSFINKKYQTWLFKRLKEEIQDTELAIVNFDNTATEVFKYYDYVVYYCNDYPIRYYYLNIVKTYFEKCEMEIAAKSALCVGTVSYLVERLRKFNPRVLELRLGAPTVEGEPCFSRTRVLRVGLVGNLRLTRISIAVIRQLIDDEHIELYIFGRVAPRLLRYLKKWKNVHVRGVVKGKALLNELGQLDLGIAPYRIEDVNAGGSPNKLWLYSCDFVNKVYEAYHEDSKEMAKIRADFAKANSWERRIDVLLEAMSHTAYRNDSLV
jgi:hypothetical protein